MDDGRLKLPLQPLPVRAGHTVHDGVPTNLMRSHLVGRSRRLAVWYMRIGAGVVGGKGAA